MKRFLELLDGAAFGLVQMLFAATALLLCCVFLALLARRSSAAVRHRIWSLGIAALLAYLFVAPFMPSLGSAWWKRHTEAVPLQVASATAAPEGDESSLPATPESDSPKLLPASADPVPSLPMDFKPPANEVLQTTEFESTSPPFPSPEVASQSAWDWSLIGRIATALWLFGMMLGLGAWLINRIALRRLVRRSLPVQEASLLQLRDEIATALKISKAISVRCSSEVAVPQTTGIWRPIVLLPAGYGRWEAERLRVSLAHEMAHIARRDVLWQSLAQLANSLYWPHPLIWLANWRMRVEREHACDDAVLAVGTGPTEYAYHLVELASALKNIAQPSSAAVAMAARSEVETRIRAILKPGLCRGPVRRSLGLALILFAILTTTAAGLLRPSFAGEDKAEVASASKKEKVIQKEKSGAGQQKLRLGGILIDEKGLPVAGVEVRAEHFHYSDRTTTDEIGEFVIDTPARLNDSINIIARLDGSRRIAHRQIVRPDEGDEVKNIRLQFEPARRLEIHVEDAKGQPVEGANAAVMLDFSLCIRELTKSDGKAVLWLPKKGLIETVHAWKSNVGLDYLVFHAAGEVIQSDVDYSQPIKLSLTGVRPFDVTLLDQDGATIRQTPVYPWYLQKPGQRRHLNLSLFGKDFYSDTNEKGIAHFDWMPNWVSSPLLEFWAYNPEYSRERGVYRLADKTDQLVMKLSKLDKIRGKVFYPNGKPAEGLRVVASGEGYGSDGFSGETMTDREGRYEIKAAPNKQYMVLVDNQKWAADAHAGFVLKHGDTQDGIDFKLRPAVRVFGRVTQGDSSKPVANRSVLLYQLGAEIGDQTDLIPPKSEIRQKRDKPYYLRSATSDRNGIFELYVGPGTYRITTHNEHDGSVNSKKFTVGNETSYEVDCRVFDVEQSMLKTTVVTGTPPRPVSKASVSMAYRVLKGPGKVWHTANNLGATNFLRTPEPVLLYAQNEEKSLAGIVEVGSDESSMMLVLQPAASAKGRLLDSKTKLPLANYIISYGIGIGDLRDGKTIDYQFGETIETDALGNFEIKGLCQDQTYHFTGASESGRPPYTVFVSNKTITPRKENLNIQIGDILIVTDSK